MIFDKTKKRLLIYFFYDKEGVVDRYIDYMLKDITKYVDELLVVCNGKLTEQGHEVFSRYTNNILVRENVGFDVWAYKTALEKVGLDNLANYGEVIMMNFTIMGPLYSFSEMFEKMDSQDLDFWGITLFHKVLCDPFGTIKYGYLPTHIQSHFIAVRTDMLASDEFKNYWKERPMINSYEEAIGYHEAIFTKTFADYGYKWGAYVDTRDEQNRCYCPIIITPKSIVEKKRCPIFKRRSFFHKYEDALDYTTGEATVELVDYIKNHLNYDMNMVYENILRVENQADIKRNMHLTYILPHDVDQQVSLDVTKLKVALVMHIYFIDLIEYCYNYAMSMPTNSDVYITTDSTRKKEKILEKFNEGPWNKLNVIVIENRGRDVSSLLVGVKHVVMDYDYVCFMHDKKVGQLDVACKGESFSYKCFENMLKSSNYVKNIINLFEQNERLGILMPPPPNFAEYYPTIGAVEWGENYDNTVELAKDLKLNVKIEESKEPVSPLGTMFWFRPKAMRKLYAKDWEYEDFPEEPNKLDGSLLHAIERIYPFVVQDAGYYPAWVMNASFAAIEVDNLYFMLRELNKKVFPLVGVNKQIVITNRLEQMEGVVHDLGRSVGRLYIAQNGQMDEKHSELYSQDGQVDYYEYENLQKYGKVNQFRWDPGELSGIEVRVHDIEIVLTSGETIYKGSDDIISNGLRINEAFVFINRDPQMYFSIDEEAEVKKIIIIAHVDKTISQESIRQISKNLSGTKKKSFLRRLLRR